MVNFIDQIMKGRMIWGDGGHFELLLGAIIDTNMGIQVIEPK